MGMSAATSQSQKGAAALVANVKALQQLKHTPTHVLHTIPSDVSTLEPARVIAYMHIVAVLNVRTSVPLLAAMMRALTARAHECSGDDWCNLCWALNKIGIKKRDSAGRCVSAVRRCFCCAAHTFGLSIRPGRVRHLVHANAAVQR